MNNNKILFALKSNTCFIKFVGELRYNLSSGFNSLVKQELENKMITQFVLDINEAVYMDSTNLGIIGMIAAGLKNKSQKKPILLGPQKDMLTILVSMGFDKLFDIRNELITEALTYKDTLTVKPKNHKQNELILESHKTLAEMNKYNKEKFTPVINAILKKKK